MTFGETDRVHFQRLSSLLQNACGIMNPCKFPIRLLMDTNTKTWSKSSFQPDCPNSLGAKLESRRAFKIIY